MLIVFLCSVSSSAFVNTFVLNIRRRLCFLEMGGKTCKPVVEASAARDALVACGELMNARHDYSRFAATCNAKGKVTKEAFMSECLVPKFGAHFTQQVSLTK